MILRSLLTLLIFALGGPVVCRAGLTVSERLRCGHYQEILQDAKQAHDGEWAFARYFLLPDKAAYEAAFKAHQSGDLLGRFIVLRCHRDGAGVKQDIAVIRKLNNDLRNELSKMEKVPPAGSYILSFLSQSDTPDRTDIGTFPGKGEAPDVAGKPARDHLLAAAEGGFAQAMADAGGLLRMESPEKALQWYLKAANLGLAEGMNVAGYLMAQGKDGVEKNEKEALRWLRQAATLGDVDAMINLTAMYEMLHFPGLTEAEAVEWINKAASTGHPLGLVEKGAALLRGTPGLKADKAAGMAELQKAAATGYSFALGRITWLFSDGKDVEANLKKAAEFGKAAWSQGNSEVVVAIAAAYEQDRDLQTNATEAAYWQALVSGSTRDAIASLDGKNPEIVKALQKIDPFSLKVE